MRAARGGDDDVGPAADVSRVLGARVYHSHGAVLLHEHQRGGHADDVGPADHNRVLPFEIHPGALEQNDATLGGAGHEERLVALHAELTDVEGVEAVDVLLQRDLREYLLLVHVLGQRELDEDAVAVGIGVEVANNLKHVLLAGVLGHLLVKRDDTGLVARLALHANVRLRVGAAAHDDHGEAGSLAVLGHQLGHPHLDLPADRRGDGLAIDNLLGRRLAVVTTHGCARMSSRIASGDCVASSWRVRSCVHLLSA